MSNSVALTVLKMAAKGCANLSLFWRGAAVLLVSYVRVMEHIEASVKTKEDLDEFHQTMDSVLDEMFEELKTHSSLMAFMGDTRVDEFRKFGDELRATVQQQVDEVRNNLRPQAQDIVA